MGNFQELLGQFSSNLVCRVAYMDGIKYVNMIEIGPVVIEIQGVENSESVVQVNNTLVHHMAFLAADTRSCVLIHQDISGLIFKANYVPFIYQN